MERNCCNVHILFYWCHFIGVIYLVYGSLVNVINRVHIQ
uniref:Uncharacterized protein n=1 Tax=Anguilla anguilla TaxID=7936 RepID=A0A0E9SLB9_ANGAN